ncbi:15, partial [Symbiodinium sp. KB8]
MHAISATPLNEWPVKLSGDLVPLASDPDETTSPAAVEFGGTRLVLELSCDTFVRDAVDMPELRTALVAGMLQDKSLAPHLNLQNLGTLFEHPSGGADVPANPTAMTQPGSWDATVIPALYRSAALGYRLAAKQAAGFFGRSTAIAIGRSLLYDPDGSAGYVKRFNGNGGPGSSLNLDAFVLNPVARLLFKYVAHFTARPHIPDPVNAPTVVTQGFETVVLVASTPAEAQQYVSDCVAAVDSVCFWDRDRALVQAEGAILLAEQAVRERFAGKSLNTNQFSALVVQFATSGGSVWPDAHLQETMATGDWSNVCARMMTYINTEASCFDDDLVLQRHLECILFWTPVATPDRDAPTLRFIRDTDALSSSRQAPRALQAAAAPDPTIIVPFWQLEAPPADPSVSSAPTGLRSGVPPVVGAVSYAAPAAGVVHGVNGTLPFDNATAYTDSCGGRGEACGAGGSGSTTDYDRLWTTPRGVELIRHFEGWTPYAFFGAYDPPGMVSIGYGHVIAEHKTARDAHYDGYDFTKEPQMDAWLVDDIGQAEACVRRYAGDVPLNANQFSALVSFVFSLGCHRFSNPATSSLQRALRAGHYDRVCSEFRKWTLSRSGSTIAGGMVKRRHAECILFWTPLGEDPAATQPLHRMPVLFSIQPLLPAGFKPGDAFPAFNLTVDASLSGAASGGALLESSRAYVLAHNASAALNHM